MSKFLDRTIESAGAALGLKLRALRRASGLSQQDVADVSGISRATVVALEQGHGQVGSLLLALEALGATIELKPRATTVLTVS